VRPAAKIGVFIDPRIGREYQLIVVGNHDGIASSLEEPHYSPPFPTVAKLYSFTVWNYDPKAYQSYNAAVACRPQRRSDAKPAQNTDKNPSLCAFIGPDQFHIGRKGPAICSKSTHLQT
jgi:hypothetical protein